MKIIEMSSARRPLAEYAADLGDEIILVTDHRKRPVAAVVPLKNVDRESIALSTNPEFLRIVQRSRSALAEGRTLTLTQMRKKVTPVRARRAKAAASRTKTSVKSR